VNEVHNADILARSDSLLVELLDGQDDFNVEHVRKLGWVVVPVESASHFDDRDILLIEAAAAALGCSNCLAVRIEHLDEPKCYAVALSREDLADFSQQCGLFKYMLLTPEPLFAVLCTTEDYFLVAGPEEFVSAAVGGSIRDAQNAFQRFASDTAWPLGARKFYQAVSERYSNLP